MTFNEWYKDIGSAYDDYIWSKEMAKLAWEEGRKQGVIEADDFPTSPRVDSKDAP